LLFATRIAGMGMEDNKSYVTRTLDEALEQHERVLLEIFRKLTERRSP